MLSIFLVSPEGHPQTGANRLDQKVGGGQVKVDKTRPDVQKTNRIFNREYFRNKTKIKNPFDLRDPFKKPRTAFPKKRHRVGKGMEIRGNKLTDEVDISELQVSEIQIVGILLGKERRALAKIKGKRGSGTFVLKEGMRIGEDNAELKAILPGGIVLVEKIRNVYDQDEYLETIIPITTDVLE